MSVVVKALIWRVVILGLIGAAFFGISKIDFSETPKHFTISKADVGVAVQPDASLKITERLTYDFSGNFSGAYRDIPLAAGVRASNISVSERGKKFNPGGKTALGSFDLPGTFGATGIRFNGDSGDNDNKPTQGFRVVWHYTATDEQRTFVISYDIEGAATAYDDVVDVDWAIWGDQWDFWLDDIDATVSLTAPQGTESAPLGGWVSPNKLGANVSSDLRSVSTSISRLPAGEQTVIRAAFPRAAFASVTGAQVKSGEGLPTIEDEEGDGAGLLRSAANFVADNIVLISILWTLLGFLITIALHLAARESSAVAPRYLPEPPEDIPPALAYAVAHEGEFDERLVVATLLDLVDRGFYEAVPTPGDELDLDLSIADDRPDTSGLADYEVEALDFFDRLLREGPSPLGKLKDRIPEHSESWRNRWQGLTAALDRAEEGELDWDLDLSGYRTALALFSFAGYAWIIGLYFTRTHFLLIPLFAAIVGLALIFLLPDTMLKRLDQKSRERNANWKAFSQWTRDFPRLDDDPPATLKLWRRILVYAVAFGTAERVIGSGRIPPPVLEEAASHGALWMGPHLGSSGGGITPSFDGFASGFSSQVAPESSDGGGGFSGGGGGSSGGGGGGAW